MDRDGLAARLRADEVAPGYLRPRYGGHSFADVPATAAAAVGVDLGPTVPAEAVAPLDGVERVVTVIVDGFGWSQWSRDAADHRFFRALVEHGTVTPLSSIYPSETAACMTTFHTATPPVRHGLVGWGVYAEPLGTVVEPLPFVTAAGEPLDDLADTVPDAELLFSGEPVYPDLRAAGVDPTVIQPALTVDSPYSARVLEGASVVAYRSVRSLADTIRRTLESGTTPQYVHAYYPVADEAAHHEGSASAAYHEACADLARALDGDLAGSVDPEVAAETLLLVTADHGVVDTHPPSNVDLYAMDGVRDRLRRTDDGGVVPPAGSPRNVHLHARPGEVEALGAALERRLDALVLTRDEVVELGLFGDGDPSALFDRRVGDLVVVPRDRSVWYGPDSSGLEHVGMHGGLHPDELLVPLASARLADLQT